MKGIKLLIVIFLFGCAASSISQNRIMLVGDSITRGLGSTDELGFRDALYDSLLSVSYPFSFVGGSGTEPYLGHFKGGIHVSDLYDGPGGTGDFNIEPRMDNWTPHILLIHVGTNDMSTYIPIGPYTNDGGQTFVSTTVSGQLAYLMALLLQWKTGERGDFLRMIYVSKIIPQLDRMPRVQKFNSIIDSIHTHSEADQIPLIPPGSFRVVDHFSTFDPDSMMKKDGIHPNDLGHEHMAGVYFDAVKRMPFSLARFSDEVEYGVAGQMLLNPLVVCVEDGFGNEVPRIDVTFEVIQGDVSILEAQPVQTDEQGLATSTVQLGAPGISVATVSSAGLLDSVVTFQIVASDGLLATGHVTYYSEDVPIPDVFVEDIRGEDVIDTTDGIGQYYLTPLHYMGTVSIRAEKERDGEATRDAILSYDAALVARSYMDLESLSAMQSIAADVDGDSRITLFDAAQIARYAVGLPPETTSRVAEWRFQPDSLVHTDLTTNLTHQDFQGILLGDIHGGWPALSPPLKPYPGSPGIEVAAPLYRNDSVLFPVVLGSEGILALDLTVQFDTQDLELIDVLQATEEQTTILSTHTVEKNCVRIGLYGIDEIPAGQLFYIRCRVLTEGQVVTVKLKNIFLNDMHREDVVYTYTPKILVDNPVSLELSPNFPNPFNAATSFRYRLPEKVLVRISVYNTRGQKVADLIDGVQGPGQFEMIWDGRNDGGQECSSGLYLLRLDTDREHRTVPMEIVR